MVRYCAAGEAPAAAAHTMGRLGRVRDSAAGRSS